MFKIIIITPSKELINQDCDFITASGDNGQIGILQNHLPTIMKISNGFVKVVTNDYEVYVAISSGVLDFNNNVCTVVCQNAVTGPTYEEAKYELDKIEADRIKNNKQKMVNFVDAERDLIKAIREANASKI